jgi:pimeloyl-ACP methyl ester carboxylesterase
MGGNIASIYAGTRPGRIERLVMLDALGELLHRDPIDIVEVLRLALDARAESDAVRGYPGPADLANRLRRGNPRLTEARAGFLAAAMARTLPDGRVSWPGDPSFRRSFPLLHTPEEWRGAWGRITAPVLCIKSSDFRRHAPTSDPQEVERRAAWFRNITLTTVPETGHNVHHDAPGLVARTLEDFLLGSGAAERKSN